MRGRTTPNDRSTLRRRLAARWWLPTLGALALSAALFVLLIGSEAAPSWPESGTAGWWTLSVALHLPYGLILLFLAAGLVERIGYYRRGRAPELGGSLPRVLPTVCVQLPMFNEHAVGPRAIEAACALDWPTDRLTVQVLDDSTDPDARRRVEEACVSARLATGVDCRLLHRDQRVGYKAGALEEGRKRTAAELLVILDADFVPPQDFLRRTIPHFYDANGEPDPGLALVQAQWGHLNHEQSLLTRAQSLWVDDHHTVQMSWRSAMWRFVNFTGTGGIWQAEAIERVGGWSAASLVEDCELSFRHLFAGYRTKFVKEVVVPAELPATFTAYKAQQRRWTQGWAQLQRMHAATLLFRFRSSWIRRAHLLYHMCSSWQWPAWALWLLLLPFLIQTGLWYGDLGTGVGLALYLLPGALWALVAATVASLETRHTYAQPLTPATFVERLGRMVPHTVLNAGMLPHQLSAFAEGMLGPLHGEFERTPKTATVTSESEAEAAGARRPAEPDTRVRIHWPYVLTEAAYAATQAAWAVLFVVEGLIVAAFGAGFLAASVVAVGLFYGDDRGKVCFALDSSRLRPSWRGTRPAVPSGLEASTPAQTVGRPGSYATAD